MATIVYSEEKVGTSMAEKDYMLSPFLIDTKFIESGTAFHPLVRTKLRYMMLEYGVYVQSHLDPDYQQRCESIAESLKLRIDYKGWELYHDELLCQKIALLSREIHSIMIREGNVHRDSNGHYRLGKKPSSHYRLISSHRHKDLSPPVMIRIPSSPVSRKSSPSVNKVIRQPQAPLSKSLSPPATVRRAPSPTVPPVLNGRQLESLIRKSSLRVNPEMSPPATDTQKSKSLIPISSLMVSQESPIVNRSHNPALLTSTTSSLASKEPSPLPDNRQSSESRISISSLIVSKETSPPGSEESDLVDCKPATLHPEISPRANDVCGVCEQNVSDSLNSYIRGRRINPRELAMHLFRGLETDEQIGFITGCIAVSKPTTKSWAEWQESQAESQPSPRPYNSPCSIVDLTMDRDDDLVVERKQRSYALKSKLTLAEKIEQVKTKIKRDREASTDDAEPPRKRSKEDEK